MTAILVRNSLCLNPEVELNSEFRLPIVANIESEFRWTLIEDLYGKESVDFGDGLNDENLESKRQDENYEELVQSIREDGILNPVFWDGDTYGNGHHRLAACVELGYTHIPTTNDDDVQWNESGITTGYREDDDYEEFVCDCGCQDIDN